MQQMQFDPITVLTHAAISSMMTGAISFVNSVISGLFLKPMVDMMAQQIAGMISGGMHSLPNADTPSTPPLLRPPFPPPLFFSVTPDGQMQLSIPVDKAVEQFMPLLFVPPAEGGKGE